MNHLHLNKTCLTVKNLTTTKGKTLNKDEQDLISGHTKALLQQIPAVALLLCLLQMHKKAELHMNVTTKRANIMVTYSKMPRP